MTDEHLPLVLIPGFMLDTTLWDEFAPHFTGNRTVIRMNLAPGETLAEIAHNITQALPERFILAGFSLGGYVARSIVEQFPQRVAGLMLIATSLREDSIAQREQKRQAVSLALSTEFKGLSSGAIAKSLGPEKADDRALIKKIREMGKNLGAAAFQIQSGLVRDHITVKPITCPTLVIAGRQDGLRTLAETQEIVALIKNSELKIIEDSGHLIPLEQPDLLAKIAISWLERSGL